jgi:hypothetical protein
VVCYFFRSRLFSNSLCFIRRAQVRVHVGNREEGWSSMLPGEKCAQDGAHSVQCLVGF